MKTLWETDRDYLEIVQDLLVHKDVQRLAELVHHKVTDRLTHCLNVSYRSYRVAKRLGLDAHKVARAGLLHDLFFYEGEDKHEVGGRGHNFEHPRIALRNALKITELCEVERDIILKHMSGATNDVPLYPESLLVSYMDKQVAMMELCVGYSRRVHHFMRRVTLAWVNQ